MTAAAMIFGMVPMAIGFGEGGSQAAPLGRAVIGGLIVSTFATLTILPRSTPSCKARAVGRVAVAQSDGSRRADTMKRLPKAAVPRHSAPLLALRRPGRPRLVAGRLQARLADGRSARRDSSRSSASPLHAKVAGYVERVLVDRGSVVKQGDLLVELSAPEMTAQIAEAESKVQAAEADRLQAEAQLAAAQSTYERLKKAAETPGAIAGNELVQAEKQVEAAQALVRSRAAGRPRRGGRGAGAEGHAGLPAESPRPSTAS